MKGPYSKLETPEAQLEYLMLSVCRSRSAPLPARGWMQDFGGRATTRPQRRAIGKPFDD